MVASVPPTEQNKRIIRAMIAAVNAQRWDELDELVSESVVRHSQNADAPPVRSRSALKAFLRGEAQTFPDAEETVLFLVAEDDKVAARLRFRGTQKGPLGPFPASERTLVADFTCMYRLEGGRVAEIWVEWDTLGALIQLGHYAPPS